MSARAASRASTGGLPASTRTAASSREVLSGQPAAPADWTGSGGLGQAAGGPCTSTPHAVTDATRRLQKARGRSAALGLFRLHTASQSTPAGWWTSHSPLQNPISNQPDTHVLLAGEVQRRALRPRPPPPPPRGGPGRCNASPSAQRRVRQQGRRRRWRQRASWEKPGARAEQRASRQCSSRQRAAPSGACTHPAEAGEPIEAAPEAGGHGAALRLEGRGRRRC